MFWTSWRQLITVERASARGSPAKKSPFGNLTSLKLFVFILVAATRFLRSRRGTLTELSGCKLRSYLLSAALHVACKCCASSGQAPPLKPITSSITPVALLGLCERKQNQGVIGNLSPIEICLEHSGVRRYCFTSDLSNVYAFASGAAFQ